MKLIEEYKKLSRSESIYVLFLGFVWTNSYFDTFWRRLFHVQEQTFSYTINFILLLILASLCVNQWKHRVRPTDVILYIGLVLSYFLCGSFYPNISDQISENAICVVFATLPYIVIGAMYNHKDYKYWITVFSCAAVILNLLYLFMRAESGAEAYNEQMRKSYSLLPSVLYLFYRLVESRRITDLVFFLIGFLILCSLGSRGPFVCLIFFASFFLFLFKDYKHKIIVRTLIVVIASFLTTLTQFIAETMILVLSYFGMKSRIFDKMLNDAFINYESSSGRNDIQEILLQKLNDGTADFGFGPFSDRKLTFWYAHNLIVELWFDYGYYIGTAILVSLAYVILKFLIISNDRESKVFVLLLFSAGIVKLMFSGSYLDESNFYFLIGVCIYGIRQSKNNLYI